MKPSVFLNIVLAAALVAVSVRWATTGSGESAPANADSVVYNNIMTRTSVRSYLDKPVEDSKIDTLLHAAMAAPTAMNTQPWHFVVIKDRATLDKIAEATPNARMAAEAPLAIVVCGNMTNEHADVVRMFWTQDLSAATENLLLQAHAMGLGAVWTGTYPDQQRCDAVSSLLSLSDNLIPLCTVVIGYPKGEQTPKDKWNPDNVTYFEGIK
jgi:nitroreductase